MTYEMLFFEGQTKITLDVSGSGDTKSAIIDIKAHGVQIFAFCEDVKDELIAILNTLKTFAGSVSRNGMFGLFDMNVPDYLAEANVEFLKWSH